MKKIFMTHHRRVSTKLSLSSFQYLGRISDVNRFCLSINNKFSTVETNSKYISIDRTGLFGVDGNIESQEHSLISEGQFFVLESSHSI